MDYQQTLHNHYKSVRDRITNARMKPKSIHPPEIQFFPNVCELPPKKRIIEPDPRREILRQCATEFGCTVSDILSDRKTTNIMLARRKAMWLLHKRGTMSKAAIGRYLNKDHTTVIHALRGYEKSLARGEA